MGTPHPHRDMIKAWADGATIQGRPDADTEWLLGVNPGWYEDWEYRIKPKIVKREGWVNIYRTYNPETPEMLCCVHATEEAAKTFAAINVVATMKIEWEEEE